MIYMIIVIIHTYETCRSRPYERITDDSSRFHPSEADTDRPRNGHTVPWEPTYLFVCHVHVIQNIQGIFRFTATTGDSIVKERLFDFGDAGIWFPLPIVETKTPWHAVVLP